MTWHITGTVARGLGSARSLGYPTVNIRYEQPCDAPFGVYCASADFSERSWSGVAVVGGDFNADTMTPKVEIHIFGSCDVAVGAPVSIALLSRVSELERMTIRDDLIKKIERDVRAARVWWAEQNSGQKTEQNGICLPE